MKKLLFILLLLPLTFIACSSDEDSLEGTTWVYTEETNGKKIYTETITFHKDTYTVKIEDINDPSDNDTYGGKYTYKSPIVTFIEKDNTWEGKIDGNRLIMIGEDGKEEDVFIKK